MGMLLRRHREKKEQVVKPEPKSEPKAAPKKSVSKKKGE
jgi:hypothetical protein